MAQTPQNSTDFNEEPTSAQESGSEISDMASTHELGMEVESQSHEDNQDPPVPSECEYASILNISNLSKPDIVSLRGNFIYPKDHNSKNNILI
ncbi:hypothetical protein O181_053126 [Austropuccinia psidii MF-1]|uniref:Uncharacterized protein n=1 Tax=Austropuccinia psidii MF-1 TaxID=1389203 RepID=A0A9Q3E6X4_9BASI|nr:hypothetical protein [Austropuccinia psidii MF-1]